MDRQPFTRFNVLDSALRSLLIAFSFVLFTGCDTPIPEPSEGIVLDHSAWVLASEADDPWSDRLESLSGSCAELAWRVEGTGDAALLEVETSECSGAAVSHPIQGVLKRGDTVTFILWHLPLVKPEVSKAQLGIALDGIPVWSMEVDLPAEATVYQSEFIVPADAHRAETLTIHVDNHGSNSWRFYTFEYAR